MTVAAPAAATCTGEAQTRDEASSCGAAPTGPTTVSPPSESTAGKPAGNQVVVAAAAACDKQQVQQKSDCNNNNPRESDNTSTAGKSSRRVEERGEELVACANLEANNDNNGPATRMTAKGKKDKKSSKEAKGKSGKKTKKTAKANGHTESQSPTATCEGQSASEKLSSKNSPTKPRSLVEELKLFQNNHLLYQQDPIQQLQINLSELIEGASCRDGPVGKRANADLAAMQVKRTNPALDNHHRLSAAIQRQQANNGDPSSNVHLVGAFASTDEENISTIKKGVLWQQQNYDKFHQRLFSRWRKRYFILTTDYLVCFKRSASKVGRSEMGKFLYKIALSDVTKIEWLKPKKSDKGAIVLYLNGPYNLLLWTKQNLEEWMFMIDESIGRIKIRRSCLLQNSSSRKGESETFDKDIPLDGTQTADADVAASQINGQQPQLDHELYENTVNPAIRGTDNLKSLGSRGTSIEDDCEVNNNDPLTSNDPAIKSQTITKYSRNIADQSSFDSPVTRGSQRSQKNSLTHEKTDNGCAEPGNVAASGREDKSNASCNVSSSSQSAASSISGKSANEREQGKGCIEQTDHEHDHHQHQHVQRKGEATKFGNVQASGRTPQSKPAVIYDPASNDGQSSTTGDSDGNSVPNAASNQAEQSSAARGGDNKISKSIVPRSPRKSAKSARPSQTDDSPAKNLQSQVARESANQQQQQSALASQIPGSPNVRKKAKKNESNLVKEKKRTTTSQAASSEGPSKEEKKEEAANEAEDAVQSNTNHEALEKKCNSSVSNSSDGNESRKNSSSDRKHLDNVIQHQTATTNLIRRDDSWQSLVSLTRAGKVTPMAMQVAQRSLYAQHIMPDSAERQMTSSNRISIESTVTPSRAPLTSGKQNNLLQRQASACNQHKFRPLPPIGGQLHSASFDVAPSSPQAMHQLQQQQQQQPAAAANQRFVSSYQQKLLQLQHSAGNHPVDHIRLNNNNADSHSNDYQIYEASSHYGYGYGYSSMRSQLKSAASEFSFIRPSSSSVNPAAVAAANAADSNHNFIQRQQTAQSTLPHHYSQHHHQQASYVHQSPSTRNNKLILTNSSLGLGDAATANSGKTEHTANNDIGSCMSPLAKQFLVHPVTGERIINQASELMVAGCEPMAAPMRELPLKPNKKRGTASSADGGAAAAANNNHLPKSSSLTASIACFFRRAFSRRSKRGASSKKKKQSNRSALAESSSSLGAFGDDAYTSAPMIPSAFSTGSKSVDGSKKNVRGANQQQQRMVDMIEAFTNQTAAAAAANAKAGEQATFDLDFNATPKVTQHKVVVPALGRALPQVQPRAVSGLNQFGSPLHKSNSISTTMGLSYACLGNGGGDSGIERGALLYDNAMIAVSGGSPMMMRSTKVLSANLTPLMSQRANEHSAGDGNINQQHQQFFLSPRNSHRPDHLPRPSSIYGQPSMISSPVITRDDNRLSNQFGAHRNSFHNQHFRDSRNSAGEPAAAFSDLRRQQMAKAPFLDTTREVAEEISSPTAAEPNLVCDDDDDGVHQSAALYPANSQRASGHHESNNSSWRRKGKFDNNNMISASPSSGKLYQRHQAIVNPILQSPTMSTIYDNHPIVMRNNISESPYSHYDNHNQLLLQNHHADQSPSLSRRSKVLTPSHSQYQRAPSVFETNERAINMLINNGNKKPSAMVAPSTPQHHVGQNPNFRDDLCSGPQSLNDHQHQPLYQSSRSHHVQQSPIIQRHQQSRSPMLSRRNLSGTQHPLQQHQYQQSPLVSHQTRVLNKGDGVQATIVGERDSGNANAWPQPVINIAGAPGINLEPSLAASLLKGTNIDAYESSTFDRGSINSQSNSRPKTFLVSTRLSKSMAYSQSSSNDNDGSTSSMLRDESNSQVSNNTTYLRSSRDELSSFGSRSINSSFGERGSLSGRLRKGSKVSTNSSGHEDLAGDESSGSDTHGGKSAATAIVTNHSKASSKRSPRRKSRGDSSADEPPSSQDADGSANGIDHNWITSKLAVENQ